MYRMVQSVAPGFMLYAFIRQNKWFSKNARVWFVCMCA